ncbi:hypothetical protein Ga0609869_002298 [Rhodovulum iodosum]|uniref:Uncharacterized protein n=1 Tax=Rhodovulum iodosum TaxID=68291 RepID=A0ABV3XUC5_9RHOB|nr:hypothetical protein [Rhodovulum robiginosum]RSK34999.1 hypothetical protein EJA01_06260 [Rhodovulum robiginosum]
MPMRQLAAFAPLPRSEQPLGLLIDVEPAEVAVQRAPLPGLRLETLPYALIHAALARAPWADFVASPLVSEHFDALDLACQLDLAGFTGKYIVLTPPLPRPGIIHREIAQLCPRLAVELRPRAPH